MYAVIQSVHIERIPTCPARPHMHAAAAGSPTTCLISSRLASKSP